MKEEEIAVNWQEKYLNLKTEYEEFAYIVSHDLKAPLRAIQNLSEWICEDLGDTLPGETKQNVQLLQNRTKRMEGLINAILQFSRVERTDLEVQEIDVSAVVEELAAPYHIHQGLQWQRTELPTFATYAKKLKTVLQHLLHNAVQFNQSQLPKVSIAFSEGDTHYTFKVTDNGMGIAPEALKKVFQLFYTVAPKDKAENMGVGLTLVRKIVLFAGGAINVTSELGKGSSVIFTWPKEIRQ